MPAMPINAPLAIDNESSAARAASAPPETPATVLVIDDELGPRESLRFLLNNECLVLCAESVDRGLELLRTHQPDVIILDIRMPGRNGIDGLRDIRRLDADVSVIMLTGFGALSTAQEAVRHEANDYMEKPFDAGEMRRAVERHVARTRACRRRGQLAREVGQLQERLAGALTLRDHMAEMGQASGEFVHDLRNALGIIYGSADLLRQELGHEQAAVQGPGDVSFCLGTIERAMQQCNELLDSWQRLIRQDPAQQSVFRLADCVEKAVANYQTAARSAHAELVFAPAEGHVLGDRVQITRAVANLVHNAIQALPAAGGRVLVTLALGSGSLYLRVSDNGCGISPEHLERIFMPNFTTRRSRGGMGLGLFIARKIVQAHNGQVAVESVVGQGTTMSFILPCAPCHPASPCCATRATPG